jgi:hypothetical protein
LPFEPKSSKKKATSWSWATIPCNEGSSG